MAEFLIAGLGEILWDVLADSEEIGGAPVNFAYHAGVLGADSIAVSTIGNDERGRRAIKELTRRGLNLEAVSIDQEHATGFVEASVDADGVAHYIFPNNIAWDHLTLNAKALSLAPKVDAVCFGTLAQRSETARASIHVFLNEAPQALKVYDMNLRQHFYNEKIIRLSLEKAHVLKLNDDELRTVAPMFNLSGSEQKMLSELHNKFDLKYSVLTRGGNGSLLMGEGKVVESCGVEVQNMQDTIGAGDSFTASVIIGLLQGHSLEDISDHANRLAAYVCSCKGAMPAIPDEFKLIK
ncbi:carbohydrate kinase [Maridesulfovibrio ferrireducens]|uniref:carbohydrate kinase family protein n=1 Tax=Maridesulfovibrio ferrireducens TaxID=246191 RepID=UPI001A286DA5|nr:carbohydrate kinase [Maridesulfovibrio ferrireducens]MBI9110666.1 carbohydrate kinase [Maridesulfovibrio ferrireducens]